MIGSRITINGQEWEEIDWLEYRYTPTDDCSYFKKLGNEEYVYYKKVIKEVFPKVFEGEDNSFSVESNKNGNIPYLNVLDEEGDEVIFFEKEKDIEALKQALAFRDKMLEGKK